ncbi:MAG: YHS domain-containing (seleno)protein [Cyclobacteriaceae bacterium]|nr:hypothetical protein [Cyclobacteriaceae bacterium]
MRSILLLLTCLQIGLAFSQSGELWYYNIDDSNLALQGYDPVSYWQGDVPQKGSEKIYTQVGGITYRFINQDNAKKFKTDPSRYLPQFGGWCTYFMGVDKSTGFARTRMPADPDEFVILDGKLYLFAKTARRNYKESFLNGDKKLIIDEANKFWQTRVDLAKLAKGLPKGLNPKARMELLQWQPFMGSWDVDLKWWADTTGTNVVPSEGTWDFYYGYFGYCVQDDFRSKRDVLFSGTVNGPAIRGFDPVSEEWHMTYIPVNQGRGATWLMTAKFLGIGQLEGRLDTQDPYGNPVIQKVVFERVNENKFYWRAHWSWDNGSTWKENVGLGVCTRKSTG